MVRPHVGSHGVGYSPASMKLGRNDRKRIVHFALAAALSIPVAGSTPAPADDPTREFLRERIESIESGTRPEIRGAAVAAVRALAQLYERRGFAPAWSAEKAEQLLLAIRDAQADGLDPADYHLKLLEQLRLEVEGSTSPSIDLTVDLDLLLTDALARLGYHILFGKVDPEELDANWNYVREMPDLDPPDALQEVIDSADVRETLSRAKPQYVFYSSLKAALAQHREIASRGGWGSIPPGPALRVGDTGPRVAALRARLSSAGDTTTAPANGTFDEPLAAAVGRFQARHGLAADGVAGQRTIEEMNVPVQARIDQIRVNLERGRWLLHAIGDEFVAVNIAGFELYYFRNGKVAWNTPVQVGKPYRKTPVFRSRITYLVFNPTWTVPPGILANDILPAQRRDHSTLEKKGLGVFDSKGRPVATESIDWDRMTASRFRYVLRQAPGPNNALGRVKFMFPNDHAVYLHDTPSKGLFEKEDRAFSSGCIRVADPLRLAELLLEGQSGWSRAEIDRAIAAGATRSVTLKRPVPVWLTYWTAWVDGSGNLELRRDLYGRDARVLAGLDAGFRVRRRGV